MADQETVTRMTVREFIDEGYLQELNRGFLHPLGLALEVQVLDDSDSESTELSGSIWDYRDDPEGIRFEGMDLAPKAESIRAEREARRPAREAALGYWQQPVDS